MRNVPTDFPAPIPTDNGGNNDDGTKGGGLDKKVGDEKSGSES